MCPMEKYISTSSTATEDISRFLSFGVSWSASSSAAAAAGAAPFAPFKLAPYPAFSTARTMSAGAAVPSTPSEFVSRLTAHEETPGTAETAFSTRAEHAAQLMPVTEYCVMVFAFLLWCIAVRVISSASAKAPSARPQRSRLPRGCRARRSCGGARSKARG